MYPGAVGRRRRQEKLRTGGLDLSHRMNKRRTPVALVCLCLLPLILAGAISFAWASQGGHGMARTKPAAQAECSVGKPADLNIRRSLPGSGIHLQGRVLILGCLQVRRYGLVEIVGYNTNKGFCVATDSVEQRTSEGDLCTPLKNGSGTFCAPRALCANTVNWSDTSGGVFSKISGPIAPAVARVSLAVPRGKHGGKRHIEAMVAQLSGKLREHFGLAYSFGIYAAVFPGCPSKKGVLVTAYNRVGNVVGRAAGKNFFPGMCGSKEAASARGKSPSEHTFMAISG
jgi:hypothetical protein